MRQDSPTSSLPAFQAISDTSKHFDHNIPIKVLNMNCCHPSYRSGWSFRPCGPGQFLTRFTTNQALRALLGALRAMGRHITTYRVTAVAQRCARLHVPDPRAARDALMAATAMVHGLTIVTRNVADFEPIGVQLLNPRKDQSAGRPE